MTEDDPSSSATTSASASAEDPQTAAARRELKQSTIHDQRPETPADDSTTATHEEELKDQISSPKKKRAHDQLDEVEGAPANDTNGDKKDDDAEGSVSSEGSGKNRANREGPEKKRHRDGETSDKPALAAPSKVNSGTSPTKPTQTSANTFAASGFGKLSSGSSSFAAAGGCGFGSATAPKLSSFASKPAASSSTSTTTTTGSTAPKLSFGGGGGASPFGGLSSGASSNGFGSKLVGSTPASSPFGSALGGGLKPLSSFSGGGGGLQPIGGEKPAKPFGAPDSDVESEGEDSQEGAEAEEEGERERSPEKEADDKKRPKLQKVEVDDGEAGEATISSVRAKMFYHDKATGWHERGAGMLKINVPSISVDFDGAGHPIPGTFDASALEIDTSEDDPEAAAAGSSSKIVRLLMRQDQTHRILLNTVVVPAMEFQEKASLKSVGVMFTAFEGNDAKPVSVTMRMSAANAKVFMNDIGMVQKELRGN